MLRSTDWKENKYSLLLYVYANALHVFKVCFYFRHLMPDDPIKWWELGRLCIWRQSFTFIHSWVFPSKALLLEFCLVVPSRLKLLSHSPTATDAIMSCYSILVLKGSHVDMMHNFMSREQVSHALPTWKMFQVSFLCAFCIERVTNLKNAHHKAFYLFIYLLFHVRVWIRWKSQYMVWRCELISVVHYHHPTDDITWT